MEMGMVSMLVDRDANDSINLKQIHR